MFCNVCGAQIPPSSAFCPQCGTTLAPDSASETMFYHGSSGEQKELIAPVYDKGQLEQNQPGATQSGYSYPSVPSGSTSYESPPSYYYNVVPQDPYNAPPTYTTPPPPVIVPPPVQPTKKRTRLFLIVGIIAAVLLVSCVSISVALYNAINSGLRATATTPYRAPTPSTQQSTPSPIAQVPNPYPPNTGQLVLADSLKDNSQGYKWDVYNDNSLYCQFIGGAYHLRLLPQSKYQIDWCFANNAEYTNLAYQVEMTMTKGDCGGIIFRDAGDRELYYFCITHLGGYGLYLYYKDNTGAVQVKTLDRGDSPLIYTGYNVKNLIAVAASGTTINLYVNNKLIKTVTDGTFLHGRIGVAAHQYDSKETDVLYQNAKVWTF